MNLNFIQDNDKIHVETQNQIAYKEQIILKIKLLKQDFQDYSSIYPSLNDTNSLFSQIVKDLYEHVTNCKQKTSQNRNSNELNQNDHYEPSKKKKKMSIPYGTVRKLQTLKQKFIACRKIIDYQNCQYRSLNINRQNEKKSDVKFYKAVLQSYENQRQYYKKQTLDLQDRVQQIQAVVKLLSYNDNHEFTDYDSKIISYESVFKYEKKISAFGKVLDEMKLIKKAKNKIAKVLESDLITVNGQGQTNQTESFAYAKNMVRNVQDMQRRVNLLKRENTQILQNQLLKLNVEIAKVQTINKKLKKAILQNESQKYFMDIENKIKNYKRVSQSEKNTKKITKTDILIFLKELDSRIKNYFKSKEILYICKTSSTDGRSQLRSKSVSFSRP